MAPTLYSRHSWNKALAGRNTAQLGDLQIWLETGLLDDPTWSGFVGLLRRSGLTRCSTDV
jgi:hypothetical protein